jgi:hypothetical protein
LPSSQYGSIDGLSFCDDDMFVAIDSGLFSSRQPVNSSGVMRIIDMKMILL